MKLRFHNMMIGNRYCICLVAVVVLCLSACSDDIHEDALAGRWEANNKQLRNQYGDDVLVLNADGTGSRHYEPPRGEPLSEKFKWELFEKNGKMMIYVGLYSDVYSGDGRFLRATKGKSLEISKPLFGDFRLWLDRDKRQYYLHHPDGSNLSEK